MRIRKTTPMTGAMRRLRPSAYAGEPGWPHVGECGFAGTARSCGSDRMVKQRDGGRVSATGEAM